MSPDFRYELIGIIGMSVLTFFIRALPFLRIVPKRLLQRLEEKQALFPTLFLTLLVIYCLVPSKTATAGESFLLVACACLVAILQAWRGNLLLSLGLGTGAYLFLLNGFF